MMQMDKHEPSNPSNTSSNSLDAMPPMLPSTSTMPHQTTPVASLVQPMQQQQPSIVPNLSVAEYQTLMQQFYPQHFVQPNSFQTNPLSVPASSSAMIDANLMTPNPLYAVQQQQNNMMQYNMANNYPFLMPHQTYTDSNSNNNSSMTLPPASELLHSSMLNIPFQAAMAAISSLGINFASISNNNTNNDGSTVEGIQKKKPTTPRRKNSKGTNENVICGNCGAVKSPLWRKGENGIKLCNKCGLYWARHHVPRNLNIFCNILLGPTKMAPVHRISPTSKDGAPSDLDTASHSHQ